MLKAYCSIDYATVSLIDLISEQEVRSTLQDAQNKFTSGDKETALTGLRIALHQIENPKGKRLPLLHAPVKPKLSAEVGRAGWDPYLIQLHAFLDQAAARMNAVMLSVDPTRYAKLLRSTPSVQWSISGKPTVIRTRTYDNFSDEDFADLLEFLIDYALKAEEAYFRVATGPAAQRGSK